MALRRVFVFALSCVCKDGLRGKNTDVSPRARPPTHISDSFSFSPLRFCQAQSRSLLMPQENTSALTTEHSYPSTCMLAPWHQNTLLFVFISEHLTIGPTQLFRSLCVWLPVLSACYRCFTNNKMQTFIKNQKERRKQKQREPVNTFLSDVSAEVSLKKHVFPPHN